MIGYRYFTAGQMFWRVHHGALIPLSMPHALPPIKRQEAKKLVADTGALFIRWEENFDQVINSSWWHLLKDKKEQLDKFNKKTRNQIRRGTKSFECQPTSRDTILKEGYQVYHSAFDRYKTFEALLPPQKFYDAIKALPEETEFWETRSRETGELVAFSENLVRDGACFYNTMWFQPRALKAYAGYTLIHEMNKHYLNERGLRYVSDGARSISHDTNIHNFLERKFGFRRAYARLRVVYAPRVGTAVRLLYPFRKWFSHCSSGLFQKIAVLLEQERIRRACLGPEEKA